MATAAPAGVSLGFWQDRDPMEALVTAAHADRLGYRDLWIGEMATFDAFALAASLGPGTGQGGAALVLGPLAPSVRDPAGIAMGVASVAALTGRRVHVALGASSPVVVERWHGRRFGATTALLRESVHGLPAMLAGDAPGPRGYRLRLPAPSPSPTITLAAFGPATVRLAGAVADRMVINMCTPAEASRLRRQLESAATGVGRGVPRLAAWVPAAVDPTEAAIDQLRRGVVPYLAAPGYGEMFAAAGFGALVELARGGAHPGDVLSQVPRDLVEAIGLVGDVGACRSRLAEHLAAGVDEVVLVAATMDDPGGERTLEALAPSTLAPGASSSP